MNFFFCCVAVVQIEAHPPIYLYKYYICAEEQLQNLLPFFVYPSIISAYSRWAFLLSCIFDLFFFLHSLCYESTRRDVCTINIHGGFGCRDCYHAAGLMNFQRVNGMERNIQQQHIEHTRMQY